MLLASVVLLSSTLHSVARIYLDESSAGSGVARRKTNFDGPTNSVKKWLRHACSVFIDRRSHIDMDQ